MATEAQRLIAISLSKIAQSRAHRGGVSLHKNLLVATVLQKARYIFMEEAYMIHYHQQSQLQPPAVRTERSDTHAPEELVAFTAEEAPSARCTDKENQPPECHPSAEVTYLDLDKNIPLRERPLYNSLSTATHFSSTCLKRRRAVSEWEIEEAVQSILPKRNKNEDDNGVVQLEVVEEGMTKNSDAAVTQQSSSRDSSSAMEIDRITSLVSIFSFGVTSNSIATVADNKLLRNVPTPELCSAQAKDIGDETLQQRHFLAMTV